MICQTNYFNYLCPVNITTDVALRQYDIFQTLTSTVSVPPAESRETGKSGFVFKAWTVRLS